MSELRLETQFNRNCARNRSRKTLQDLQVSAHDPNQLVPSPMAKTYKEKEVTSALDTTYKISPAVQEKENVIVRRSKRKNVVLCGKVSSKEVPKSQKLVKKSLKSKKCAAKKEDPNQSTLNAFVSSSSTSDKQDRFEPPELIEPSNPEVKPSSPSKSEINEPTPCSSSNIDMKSKEKYLDCDINSGTSSYSVAEQIEWMTSENPPPSYWKELAEQRRIALDKTLYENAQLYDQLEVLQTENSQLKSLLQECEMVIQSVQNSLD